ncbi:MAG: hypothetical protein ISS35_02555 [Kiritimatiellae bacterium]|nr:hypothetical protein [Kiritimatiellia bacterium]
MVKSYTYSLADIRLNIESDALLARHPSSNCLNANFDSGTVTLNNCVASINTNMISKIPLDPQRTNILFETHAWNAWNHEEARFLSCYTKQPDSLEWLIKIDTETNVTFYFNGLSVHGLPDGAIINPLTYPPNQALFIHLFQRFNAILMHGVGFVLDGIGALCVGKSGAGKSTLANIIEPAGARVLSDDRIVVRYCNGQQYLYGTPWPGDAGHARNEGHPLSHLLFLVQSEENKLVSLSPFEAVQRLMPVCSIPWYDEAMVTAYFAIIDRIVRDIPCAELHFTRSDEVLDVLNDLKA